MRVIITGGTGLIGRSLTDLLISNNHAVTILSRSPEKARDIPAGADVVKWDGLTSAGWGDGVNRCDAIVNLAGAGIADARWSESRKKLIRESRLQAGRAVMEAIEKASQKPKVLIQASAVGYYGARSGDTIITEESAPGSDFLATVCFDWEASTSGVEHHGVRRAVIRTGLVLSNDGGAWPKIKLPYIFFAGGPLGNGQQWYPWIHIADEVRAIQYLIENDDASGPFNLCAPVPVTNQEMAQTIGRIMGSPAFLRAPAFALRTVLGEMATVLLDGQRAIPKKLLDRGFTFNFPDIESAVRALTGARPSTVDNSVQTAESERST